MTTAALLRLATAGSVDDGKSTLIGRLLHDSSALFDDQLEAVAASSRRRGHDGIDLSLFTDGLRAEREQGITIDVAYRYFATPVRSFVIADTPGHAQYTRNMVTGASTADLAVILVDAQGGLTEQSRRHACVASLLGIRQVVLAVNKMDLVDFSESAFDEIVLAFLSFAEGLELDSVTPIPMSALLGDNVVEPSTSMAWYLGPTLLGHLEHASIGVNPGRPGGARLPVQWVHRPEPGQPKGQRAYSGMLAGGVLRPGDEVLVQPSGMRTTIAALSTFDGPLAEATPTLSVTVRLADDLDVGRGDLIVHADAPATVTREIEAVVCWLGDRPAQAGARYLLKHTTRQTRAVLREVVNAIDVNSLVASPAASLAANDLGVIRLSTADALAVDPYASNRTTGSFILIDESTHATVAAGMVAATKAMEHAERPARG
ncbi:MAG: GTP-binding protein [Acidimicrobiales bacterium]